jgi:hypothetical protein
MALFRSFPAGTRQKCSRFAVQLNGGQQRGDSVRKGFGSELLVMQGNTLGVPLYGKFAGTRTAPHFARSLCMHHAAFSLLFSR